MFTRLLVTARRDKVKGGAEGTLEDQSNDYDYDDQGK